MCPSVIQKDGGRPRFIAQPLLLRVKIDCRIIDLAGAAPQWLSLFCSWGREANNGINLFQDPSTGCPWAYWYRFDSVLCRLAGLTSLPKDQADASVQWITD